MLGGVTVNFVLAVIIYVGLAFAYGDEYVPADSLKDGFLVTEKALGDKLGVQTGDNIVAVDGNTIEAFRNILPEIVYGETMTIVRDGRTFDQDIPVDFIATLSEDRDKVRFLTFRQPFIIKEVSKGSLNEGVDFQEFDEVIKINNIGVTYVDQVKPILEGNKGQEIVVTVKRKNGSIEALNTKVSEEGTIGVALGGFTMQDYAERGYFDIETKKYSFMESIPAGIDKGVSTLNNYIKGMKKIFNPDTGAYKEVGGFAAIGGLFPGTWNWPAFWNTTAFISIILAFMNILPIPALDGGHVAFLLYEIVTGRKPSDKFLEYAQMIGFFILIALLLFANGNDLYKWLFK